MKALEELVSRIDGKIMLTNTSIPFTLHGIKVIVCVKIRILIKKSQNYYILKNKIKLNKNKLNKNEQFQIKLHFGIEQTLVTVCFHCDKSAA